MSFTQTDKAIIISLCHYAIFFHNLPTARTAFIFFRATHYIIASGNMGTPAGYFCTRGKKEYASIRQAIVACGDWLVKNETIGGPQKILLYFWGKGPHKQKSEHCSKKNAISKAKCVTWWQSPGRAPCCLRQWYAFGVILLSQWYAYGVIFALRASYGFTLTSAESRIYNFGNSQNITWKQI